MAAAADKRTLVTGGGRGVRVCGPVREGDAVPGLGEPAHHGGAEAAASTRDERALFHGLRHQDGS